MMYPMAGPSAGSRSRITNAPVGTSKVIVAVATTAVACSGSEVPMTSWGDIATGTQLATVTWSEILQFCAAGSSSMGSVADSALHDSASGVAAMQSGTWKLAV